MKGHWDGQVWSKNMCRGTEETGSVQPGKETPFAKISLLFIPRQSEDTGKREMDAFWKCMVVRGKEHKSEYGKFQCCEKSFLL